MTLITRVYQYSTAVRWNTKRAETMTTIIAIESDRTGVQESAVIPMKEVPAGRPEVRVRWVTGAQPIRWEHTKTKGKETRTDSILGLMASGHGTSGRIHHFCVY
jgi:hypothetical protein